MQDQLTSDAFAPPFEGDAYSDEQKELIAPFFSNLDKSVYAPLIFAPELIGALCSRASRAKGDLRRIFLDEYITPFLDPERSENDTDEDWQEKQRYSEDLKEFIHFLQRHPITDIFSNPRARTFYIKWLAQYGDDSIAQMAGMHVAYAGLSQVAIKHFEDQRIGLAPIEKSTRYVDYSSKVDGRYRYYTDPRLAELGLKEEYEQAMDGLFDTYASLIPQLKEKLSEQYPDEKASVIEKKAFDTLRGLLPTSTLSQVAFYGNGQAFEYLMSRSLRHGLGEIRWAAEGALSELDTIAPSFLRRLKDEESKETSRSYQEYLAGRGARTVHHAHKHTAEARIEQAEGPCVELVEYDPDGEAKVLTGILYASPDVHGSWQSIFEKVQQMSDEEKDAVLDAYLAGRDARWQKVGRAFENAFLRFDIVVNIGAWRDIHRHRMLTQQRQMFSCHHGYDMPPEVTAAGLEQPFRDAVEAVEAVYEKIAEQDVELAQYAVTLTHRMRFMQYQNLRSAFWEMELRTIPEGHPDYRAIEQEKFRLVEKVYPRIANHMRVNVGNYDFARRGQEEKIQAKLRSLEEQL